ncbi:MAG: hypothetical protein WCQ16_00170 [Verrucomicrobiae bacterium]
MLALAAFGRAGVAGPSAGAPSQRPNIIIVLADDLGYECIGADGGETYQTPVLDKLAQTGMRFDMPGFKPPAEYVREMKRYGLLPETFDLAKDPINVYEMDRKYWDSFIYKPASHLAPEGHKQ